MDKLYEGLKWLYEHPEVTFSGIGVTILVLVLTALYRLVFSRIKSIKEKKENDEVNLKCARIMELRSTELRIQCMPELFVNGVGTNAIDRFIWFDLVNGGEPACITRINVLTNNLKVFSISLPYLLHKGETVPLKFRFTGNTNINESNFDIELYFNDKIRNSYKSRLSGSGTLKLISTEYIAN